MGTKHHFLVQKCESVGEAQDLVVHLEEKPPVAGFLFQVDVVPNRGKWDIGVYTRRGAGLHPMDKRIATERARLWTHLRRNHV